MPMLREGLRSEPGITEPNVWRRGDYSMSGTSAPVVKKDPRDPVINVPPTIRNDIDLSNDYRESYDRGSETDESEQESLELSDLYPSSDQVGDVSTISPVQVATPVGAEVVGVDTDAFDRDTVGFSGFDNEDLREVRDRVGNISAGRAGNLRVDEDLARIMEQDSPLLSQARAQAAQYANRRGLMNSSMAAGETYGRMVSAALPMAQQNARQVLEQGIANAQMSTQASIASAANESRLAALEAQLGTQVNMFNASQLNRAEELTQQLNAAAASQDAQAYNSAQQQLANLLRDAEAQQGGFDFAAEQQNAYAENQRNSQILDSISRLNQQYLQGSQAADLATIQGQYQQLIQTNETAGNLFNNYMNSMGNIMADPNMSTAQIASAASNLQRQLNAGLAMISEINGMDFGEEATPTTPTTPPTYPYPYPYPTRRAPDIMNFSGGNLV